MASQHDRKDDRTTPPPARSEGEREDTAGAVDRMRDSHGAVGATLYLDQKPVLSRNARQSMQWLAEGSYPILLGPDTAEMRTGHAMWFTLALLSVFLALCYVGMPVLGLLVALLCGSDPFQVYELYHVTSSTIFPTVISTGLVVVAVCLLLSSERFSRHRALSVLLVCVTGAICALQYEIRLEGIGVFAGALLCLVMCFPQSKAMRLSFACLFLISTVVTNVSINRYFRSSFAKANAMVASYGGTPTDSGDPYYSTQWWALWSGLGDFDEKYGFLADDRAGISYYYGQNASLPSEQVHRNNYLETIRHDPAWFAAILGARLKRVLLDNTPYRMSFGSKYLDIKVSPLLVTLSGLFLLMANVLIHGKNALKMTFVNLFVLPLSIGLVAVGQLADYGLQFYCVAHLFIFAYVLCAALDGVLVLAGWRVVDRQTLMGEPGGMAVE